MIYFLSTEVNKHPFRNYLKDWGLNLILQVNFITYEQIIRYKYIPYGTYIFSDVEFLTPVQAEEVAKIWQRLSTIKNLRLLNHPLLSMKRYELLRTLYYHGSNEFNVYHLDEYDDDKIPNKFPVFLRVTNDHQGPTTQLLNTREELDRVINELSRQGKSKENRMITEYSDTSDDSGIFRKYSALIIGERIIPFSMFLGFSWMLKNSGNAQTEKAKKMRNLEETEYLETNPHESELRKIFQTARINYGRIDYSVLAGKIQTWEINSNPAGFTTEQSNQDCLVFGMPIHKYLSKEMKLAFEEIDCQTEYTKPIKISTEFENVDLKFPMVNHKKLKLLCLALLPYPYKTYHYRLLRKVQIRKLQTLLVSLNRKVIDSPGHNEVITKDRRLRL
ncbi:hypothetical protein IQ255_04905 [Pleurocapsales cyanobacterium LEGE 10410]|nr:hypothetical protein [Pleurocapsales cyanobacterium LEGE 10410]